MSVVTSKTTRRSGTEQALHIGISNDNFAFIALFGSAAISYRPMCGANRLVAGVVPADEGASSP
jgi:hypothetical protein